MCEHLVAVYRTASEPSISPDDKALVEKLLEIINTPAGQRPPEFEVLKNLILNND